MTLVVETSDIPSRLCEQCGYSLRGLGERGCCPECGRAFDLAVTNRRPSEFEIRPAVGSLLRTSLQVLFTPSAFFGGLRAHGIYSRDAWFGRCHRAFAAALLSVGLCGLFMIDRRGLSMLRSIFPYGPQPYYPRRPLESFIWSDEPVVYGSMLLPVALLIYACLAASTRLVVRITPQLAVARGVDVQRTVVRRAMNFQAVHLVPVGFLFAATVGGFKSLQIVPLGLAFYFVLAYLTGWIAGRASRPPVGPVDRTFYALRFIVVTLLIALITGAYFWLFDSPYFDELANEPRDWNRFVYLLAAEAIGCTVYLLMTAATALRKMMYCSEPAAEKEGRKQQAD